LSRYNRHIILKEIGEKGQNKLTNTKVLVVGAGGLGCPVLQYLTAAGIGTLGIIDYDIVEKSNLQRQVLFGTSSLGKNKALAAKERLEDLNNTIKINAYAEKLTYKNALVLFQKYDIVVDGTDNFEARYLINDASIITKKPLVYGGIYKFEGQVSVFNYNNGPSYRCLFPNPPKKGEIPNCAEVGVLGVLPGIIGSMQANEVLKIILGLGNVLSGKVLYYNALTAELTKINIKKSNKEINKVLSKKEDFQTFENKKIYNVAVSEISIKTVFKKERMQFVDVREVDEKPKVDELKPLLIPLSEFEKNIHKINLKKEIAVFCQSGIRSKKAVEILKNNNINSSYSIKEGAAEILKILKTVNSLT
jgi:adenylyltransferase/sulfurtransferase